MNHKVTIVVLAKYPEIFAEFKRSLEQFVRPDIRKIVVVDGDEIKPSMTFGWDHIQGPEVFTMAGNYNLGWRAVESDSDILTFNDDVYFLEASPVEKLQALAYSEPKIGMVSAYVKTGSVGNSLQMHPRKDVPITFVRTSGNGIAAYCRRDMLDEVGMFDESFTEKYGAEDADYTFRVNMAGWKVGIARDVPVKHGFRRMRAGSTAVKALGYSGLAASNSEGVQRFKAKHGHFDVQGEQKWSDDDGKK